MSIRLKFVDNRIRGIIAAGRQKVDYKTIFPDMQMPDELLDNYGNGQYGIEVDEVQTGGGTQKVPRVVKRREVPTAEQIAKRRKQLIKQNYSYDKDDEIALIKDAINAIQVGKEISMDYTQMELDRAAAKQEADNIIEADLFKLAGEHNDRTTTV